MIAAVVVLAGLLAVGLVELLADPLHLPPPLLSVLDQRASVISVFIGAAGLVVSVAALLAQLLADQRSVTTPVMDVPADSAAPTPPGASVEAPHTRSREARVGTEPAGGDGPTHTDGGDHVEFHHSTFHGTVVGKSVTGPKPYLPPEDPDERQ